jgi:NADPH2:quinone reductase
VKAAVYYQNGGPEVLRYEDVPDPSCPPDGVVIEVEVISLEGGDILHRARTPIARAPHIVGYQCAGRVREVGPKARGRKVGDKVVAVVPSGSHASRVAARTATTWLVPPGADMKTIATVPVAFCTAHEALFELARARAGDRVLVHAGGGGVGIAVIQLARLAGAEVLATASSEEKLARLRELGAAHGINYKTSDFVERVIAAVGPSGVDVVIDPVGGKVLQDSVTTLRYRGRIVHLGIAGRDPAPFNPLALWGKNGSLTGMSLMTSLANDHARTYKVIEECIVRVASGDLRVVLDRTFPLAEAASAHAYVEGRGVLGRVLMVP